MSDATNDGGPAFPHVRKYEKVVTEEHGFEKSWYEAADTRAGMSLRDYFAGQCLYAFAFEEDPDGIPNSRIAEKCYALADAMLAERAKGGVA